MADVINSFASRVQSRWRVSFAVERACVGEEGEESTSEALTMRTVREVMVELRRARRRRAGRGGEEFGYGLKNIFLLILALLF